MSNTCVRQATTIETAGARHAAPSKVLLLDCAKPVQAALERPVSEEHLTVVSAATAAAAIAELRRTEMPVVVDFGRGAATPQTVRGLRTQIPNALLFAVVAPARPDLAAEAVRAGAADVLPAPLVAARLTRA